MIEAVLIDIDNTLILYNENTFFKKFLKELYTYFEDMFSYDEFISSLNKAMKNITQCNGRECIKDHFIRTLTTDYDIDDDVVWNRFLQFYRDDYDQFQDLISPVEGAVELFKALKAMPVKTVIASHPVVPRNVQLKRVSWAKVTDHDFNLVTHIENMTYCKPQVGYYREICDMIKVKPDKCFMIGDDAVYDIAASKIGIKSYLVTDKNKRPVNPAGFSSCFKNSYNNNDPRPNFSGPLNNVVKILNSLLKNKSFTIKCRNNHDV